MLEEKNRGAQANKIGIISTIKAIFTGASSGKRMCFWTFTEFQKVSHGCHMLRLIHMCPATESGRNESGIFVIDNYFSLLFSLEEH